MIIVKGMRKPQKKGIDIMYNEVHIVKDIPMNSIEGVYATYDKALRAIFDYLTIFYGSMNEQYEEYCKTINNPVTRDEWLMNEIIKGNMSDYFVIDSYTVNE